MFVVLEGVDGSGTTTQAEHLARALSERGRDVLLTREPSQGPIGRLLRDALTGRLGGGTRLDWTALALLFAADRMDHVRQEIEPALLAGRIVISDRYVLSSLLYQSETSPDAAHALPWLETLNAQAPRADLTLVLSVSAEVAEARRRARGGEPELFERAELQARLVARYAEAKSVLVGQDVHVLDGERSFSDVAAHVLSLVLPRLQLP